MGARIRLASLMLAGIILLGCSSSAPDQHGDPTIEVWPNVCRQVLRAAVAGDADRGAALLLPLSSAPIEERRERLTGFVMAFAGGVRAFLAGRSIVYDADLPPIRQRGGVMVLERWRVSDGSDYYLGCALIRAGDDHFARLSGDRSADYLQGDLAAFLRQHAPKGPQST